MLGKPSTNCILICVLREACDAHYVLSFVRSATVRVTLMTSLTVINKANRVPVKLCAVPVSDKPESFSELIKLSTTE